MSWFSKTIYSLQNYDWILTIVVFVLTSIGLTSIYSVDLSRGAGLSYFSTQSLSFFIGLVLLFAAAGFHMAFYRSSARFAYLVALILLIGVLFFGQTIRGTTGWFRFAGFSFQPAEFAKVALILFLGWLISRYGRRFDRWQFVISSGFASLIFVFLILKQPDLGSAAVLVSIWFGLLLLTGARKRYIIALVFGFIFIAILGWLFVLQEYQKERVLTFIYPDAPERAQSTGYNINQSLIAVGAGGVFGRGLGFGSQSQLHFLPEAQTDFIFSVIAEELGFVGILIVLSLYFLLLWRLIRIAIMCNEDFAAYTVLGIVLLFFAQIVVNIGATINLLPATGLTLPFLSYGGSSLIINFLLIGIAQSIARSTQSREDLLGI